MITLFVFIKVSVCAELNDLVHVNGVYRVSFCFGDMFSYQKVSHVKYYIHISNIKGMLHSNKLVMITC